MIGGTLKKLLAERDTNVPELARRAGVPVQTLYSLIRRDGVKVDFSVLLKLCRALDVPVESFCGDMAPALPDADEWSLVSRWRRLDGHGRRVTEAVLEAELERCEDTQPVGETPKTGRIIPLYVTPAAAGFASPVQGEDYEDYTVPADSRADFAVRINGDSMEPYIKDGSVALVRRGETIRDGDVGLFFADGGMVCKQYCQDYAGDVRLFSLNRRRADADVLFPASSDKMLCCFGKLLLSKPVPLPAE